MQATCKRKRRKARETMQETRAAHKTVQENKTGTQNGAKSEAGMQNGAKNKAGMRKGAKSEAGTQNSAKSGEIKLRQNHADANAKREDKRSERRGKQCVCENRHCLRATQSRCEDLQWGK